LDPLIKSERGMADFCDFSNFRSDFIGAEIGLGRKGSWNDPEVGARMVALA